MVIITKAFLNEEKPLLVDRYEVELLTCCLRRIL